MKNLKKSEAINLCIMDGIPVNKNNCTYASRNSTPKAPVYWANPEIVCLKQDWWLILNDWNLQEINVFCIPANTFTDTQLSTRSDDPSRLHLHILCDDVNFTNNRGSKESFSRYLIKTLPYPNTGKNNKKAVKKSASTSKNNFDLLIDEFGVWLLEEKIVGSKGSASSYKSYIKALAREINKVFGKNWFQNFPLFYIDDNFAKESNLYNLTSIFLNEQKKKAKGTDKKDWNNRQSGFNQFIDFLESKYGELDEDELIEEQNLIPEPQSEPSKMMPVAVAEIPDSTVISELNQKELMSKFKFRMNTQNRWYPNFGGQNGLLYLTRLPNKLFSAAKDKRWNSLLEDDLNEMRIIVGPNENDVRLFKDVQKMQYLKDGTFLVVFNDGIFPLYTRTSKNKIILEKTSIAWKGISIDHMIPLENDLRAKINSLPTLIKISDLVINSLDELGMVNLRSEEKWYNTVYDYLSNVLNPLRDSLYNELLKLDRRYELMDRNENPRRGNR